MIPAFSIGRTQEILYELEAILYEAGCRSCVADPLELFARPHNPEAAPHWEDIPVILDSPLASRFTAAYQRLHEFWDGEARQRLGQGRNPLDFLHLLTVDEHAAHEQMVSFLARTGRPAIVIAGGGMCEGAELLTIWRQCWKMRATTCCLSVIRQRVRLGGEFSCTGQKMVMWICRASG